jgi:hypothetical protein
MCAARAASAHERDVFSRTSLALIGVYPDPSLASR